VDDVPSPSTDDAAVLAALRQGDEQAFTRLVDCYHGSMVRVARAYVATNETAEDVVQDAWLGVIRGLDRFEGRSSLKTWIFRIVINKAMTRGEQDVRSVPFSSLGPDESAIDPSCFAQSGRWSGWWLSEDAITRLPDRVVLAKESRQMIDAVIATLPPNQRLVITLRDIQGLTAEEACELVGVSEANQRVLLHRARTKVRAALERYVGANAGATT
jgi:RNA polymerase sigma-70 factor, ECF subfamily